MAEGKKKAFLQSLRSTLCKVISELPEKQVQSIVQNETLIDKMLEKAIVSAVSKETFVISKDKARQSAYSIIGNMEKCTHDLYEALPEGVQLIKLKAWDLAWRAEREKSKLAKDIDTQFVLSKKLRKEQVDHAQEKTVPEIECHGHPIVNSL
ncbi:hypothetical protein GOP47_0028074 [Adiantum capillus-veneris]|nr:hypothetical protein GOP47_0028074 [Adiantum capillus-veneris]